MEAFYTRVLAYVLLLLIMSSGSSALEPGLVLLACQQNNQNGACQFSKKKNPTRSIRHESFSYNQWRKLKSQWVTTCSPVMPITKHAPAIRPTDALGTTKESTHCELLTEEENNNSFIRFTALPFDKRAKKETALRLGGGEVRLRTDKLAKDGNEGQEYRYSWRARIRDMSMFESTFASAVTIGQFHLQNTDANCNLYDPQQEATVAPSPGFQLVTVDYNAPKKYKFQVIIKQYTNHDKPLDEAVFGLQNPDATYHRVWRLWESEVMTAQQIIDLDWFDVEFDIFLHKSKGELAFRFNGQVQPLGPNAQPKDKVDRVKGLRTYFNKCPSYPALGAYIHGYYFRAHPATVCSDNCRRGFCPEGKEDCPRTTACLGPEDRVCGVNSDEPCTLEACNICLFSDPSRCNLPKTRSFQKYIQKLTNNGKGDLWPYQFVIDYDDYRVEQLSFK